MSPRPTKSLNEPVQVFCNGVPESYSKKRKCKKYSLEYRLHQKQPQNVQLNLSNFIKSVNYLPDRILDLLEIAAYIFCADRRSTRGDRGDLEYHSWSRKFEFYIKVRDPNFWNQDEVKSSLSEALKWMTGDSAYQFDFFPGHNTGKAHLYDDGKHVLKQTGKPRIVLFSGGLDSLAGVIDLLETTEDTVWPISHSSGNPGTYRTQSQLIKAIEKMYPERMKHKILKCHLHHVRAPEESQRTRAFLYCSMALGMASALNLSEFYVYENGITALNFKKRAGMINARASRTAHPKTLRLLEKFYSLLQGKKITINAPFVLKTKAEIIGVIKKHSRLDLMNSSVSCSKTFKFLGAATHCGECSQCVDRRFAAYASETEGEDQGGIYAFDFINEAISNGETRTVITDYLRQAKHFFDFNIDHFYTEMLDQLSDAIDINKDEIEQVEQIYSLTQRHGSNVRDAIQKMVNPFDSYPKGSLSTIVFGSEFSRPPVFLLSDQIATELKEFIRRSFSKEKPKNENDLNAKIDGYLSGHCKRFQKEHPNLTFATARTVPDHSTFDLDLLVETKYIRSSTTPSVATSGIAEDLTKYPDEIYKLFIVYDPHDCIADHENFKLDFERKRYCKIYII